MLQGNEKTENLLRSKITSVADRFSDFKLTIYKPNFVIKIENIVEIMPVFFCLEKQFLKF